MSKQPVDTSAIKIPDLTGLELKPGYGISSQPPTAQERVEMARLHAQIVEATRFDWVEPAFYCVLFLLALCLAIKGAKNLYSRSGNPGRTAVVFFLLLGIRGARRVSGAAKSLWEDAKEADKRVTEIERSRPE